jgi:hypothetical protein
LLLLSVGCAGGDPPTSPTAPAPDTGTDDSLVVTSDPYATVTPAFTLTDSDFEGRRLSTAIPDDPRALLFVFHGANGDVASVTQTEWIVLYNQLVPHGVGLVLTVALDQESVQWDLSPGPANPDFQRLSRIRDQLVQTTEVDASTPVLAMGFSHGAGFTPVFASLAVDAGWEVRGMAYHQGGSLGRVAVPGFFVSAENDEEGGTPDRIGSLAEICSYETGTPCPHRVGHEVPLDPRRFARLPAYGETQSQAIFDELVGMGLVDAAGDRTVDLAATTPDEVMDAYIRTSQAPSPSLPPTQLRVVWATHRFSGEHAIEEATWLLDRIER